MGTKQFDNYADLITFTRASGATLLDSDGLLKRAGHNLLTYSEQFDNAAWTKFNASINSNVIVSPDGTLTGDKIVEDTSTDAHFIDNESLSGVATTYSYSIWAKAGERDEIQVQRVSADTTSFVHVFNLTNGTATVDSGPGTASIEAFSNGWYRCSGTLTHTATSAVGVRIRLRNGSGSGTYTGDGTSGVYLWGAHLYRADMPMVPNRNSGWTAETTYYPTTSAAYEAPRIEYDADGNRLGLLVEEQRTNLLTYSEDFSNADWTKSNATVTSNTIIAPDGTLTGDKLVEDTASASHEIVQALTPAAASYTMSFYVKANGRSFVQISNTLVGTQFINFDLANGQVGSSSGYTGTITDIGNGWYRCTATVSSAGGLFGQRISLITSSTAVRRESYTGDGTSGIYVWGAQLEAGAFPTSYIPTSGSTATRAADVASITGADFKKWFNTDEGTLFADYVMGESNNPQVPFAIDDATFNNRINLFSDATTLSARSPVATVTVSGATQASFSFATVSANTSHKMALAYKPNDFAGSFDGGTVQTDNSGVVPVVTGAGIGSTRSFVPAYINGHIKSIKYYPRRLSDAQLQELTQ